MYSDTDILFTKEEKLLKIKDLISDWDYILALRLIDEILEQDNDSSTAYHLKGYIYDIRYWEPKKAEEYYRHALVLDPDNLEAFSHYLSLLNKCKRADLVLKQLNSRNESDFGHFHEQIIFQKVLALELLGQLNDAQILINQLINSSINDDFIEDLEQIINRISKKTERKTDLSVNNSFYDFKIV